MHKLTFELPAQTFGAIYILQSHSGHIHLEFAGAPRPESAVAAHLEVGYRLLRDYSLGEGNPFALRFEIVGNNLVHTPFLKIYLRGLRHNQIGVNLLLRLVKRVCKNHHLRTSRYSRHTRKFVFFLRFATIYRTYHRIVGRRIHRHNKKHEFFAWSARVAVGRIAVDPFHKKSRVRTRKILVLCEKRECHLHLVLLFHIFRHSYQAARLIDHVMLHFRAVYLDPLCAKHQIHQRSVI